MLAMMTLTFLVNYGSTECYRWKGPKNFFFLSFKEETVALRGEVNGLTVSSP